MGWGRRIFWRKFSFPKLFMRPNPPFPQCCSIEVCSQFFLARIALAVTRFQEEIMRKDGGDAALHNKNALQQIVVAGAFLFAKISSAQRHTLGNRIALYEAISVHYIFIRAYPPK